MPVREACRLDQLVPDRGRPVVLDGLYLAVFLVDGEVLAIDNRCLHVGSPIDAGPVVDGDVFCPWHGWCYDLRTGMQRTGFGDRPGLQVYRAWVDDGVVMVDTDPAQTSDGPRARMAP